MKTKKNKLSVDSTNYQWALPEVLQMPSDELKLRLDFYGDSTLLYIVEGGIITTRVVNARDVALTLLSEVPLNSGLLPGGTIWWGQGRGGPKAAIWRTPQVWPVALMTAPFKPPRRLRLPMPGLIFICSSGSPPRIFAAKKQPKLMNEIIYHAPLFNLFDNGTSCAGSHKYPPNIYEIPDSFFTSFFSIEASFKRRSKKYPNDLLKLWEEINGKKRYPIGDLIPAGKLEEILQ